MKTISVSLLVLLFTITTAFQTDSPAGYRTGDKATDFSLKNVDGQMVSLKGTYPDAKGFIVVFTCNHCPFAKAYEQRIIDLDKKFAEKGYPVIAINPNDPTIEPEDSFEKMQEVARDHKYTFPYLFDSTQEIAKAYGATRTPHVFVLSKNGEGLTVRYIGAIDDNSENASEAKVHYVENAVNQLLSGKTVATPTTKAIGCTVKWRKA